MYRINFSARQPISLVPGQFPEFFFPESDNFPKNSGKMYGNFEKIREIVAFGKKKFGKFSGNHLFQIKWGTSIETVYYDIYLTKKAKTEMPQFLFWSRVILMYPDSPEK